MNGKYCAQIHVNQKQLVNNFVIRKQTLPKRQFAEVIALPDDIISVTKTEAINYQNGSEGQYRLSRTWWSRLATTSRPSSDPKPSESQKSTAISIVSTQPKPSNNKDLKSSQMSGNRDSDECVECVCDTAFKSVVCVVLKPYTWCLSP